MARVKGAMMTRKRRNKILKLAKGYWGAKSKHFRVATCNTPMWAANSKNGISAPSGSPAFPPPVNSTA